MKQTPTLLLSALISTAVGCANLWTSPNSAPTESSVETNSAFQNPQQISLPTAGNKKGADSTATDLYWQVPGESVEWYHIYYGATPQNLDQHLAIKTVDLEKFPSAEYGAVFRYQMGVPKNQTIYLKIVSENRMGKSGDSQLIKITNGRQEAVKK